MTTIPHDDFRAGFTIGYQLVHGKHIGLPASPGPPGTPGNSTPFLEGIKAGIRAAGAKIVKGKPHTAI